MARVVALTGLLVGVTSLIGVIRPPLIMGPIQAWQPQTRFRLGVGIRLVLGVVFVLAAPACRIPIIIFGIGILALAAAITLVLVGVQRLDAFMQWWFKQPVTSLRLWFILGIAFGVLVIYSAT